MIQMFFRFNFIEFLPSNSGALFELNQLSLLYWPNGYTHSVCIRSGIVLFLFFYQSTSFQWNRGRWFNWLITIVHISDYNQNNDSASPGFSDKMAKCVKWYRFAILFRVSIKINKYIIQSKLICSIKIFRLIK